MTHTEGWSWFDAPELSDVDLSGHSVTAILVCRNAGSWLNATLAGLGGLDRRPDHIIAVDNESTDDTWDLLDDAYEAGLVDEIIAGKANFSFGEAVEAAMAKTRPPTRWLWLLHDDAVPDHDALTELLELAARTPRLAIAVPLLVRPSRRTHAARTLEVGASVSGSGARALGLEPDEVAQGQYESSPVLGGSTCGMLVRWETLDQIGGFDRGIPDYRDGVDIGWRAQLADQWVLTCPRARMVHRQAGRSEIRTGTIAAQAGRSESEWDRLMGLRLVTAHARGLGKLVTLIRLTIVCFVGALGYVLGRAPDRAKEELQAWGDLVFFSFKPVRGLTKKITASGRRSRASGGTKRRIRSLRPTLGDVLEDAFQGLARWFHEQWATGRDSEVTLDDLLGDEFTRRVGEGKKRVPRLVWLALVVLGVAAMVRGLYRSGLVTASGLLGAPATLSDAFGRALSEAGRQEPWLLVSAALSVLTVRPPWLPVVALVAAVPVTMLVAAWFVRHRIDHAGLRWLAAAGYALLPVLLGGLNRGALWLVIIALVLPFLAEWVLRLDQPWEGARSLQSLAGLGLGGVLVVAVLPVLWVPVVVAALAVVIYAGGTARIIRTAVALVLPVLFWASAVPAYVRNPARLLLTPEPMLTPAPQSWEMLFGRPVASGLPPLWLSIAAFGVLWVGAIVVTVTGSWLRLVVLAGVITVGGGLWLTHVGVVTGVATVNPDASPWLLIAFGLFLYAFVAWLDVTRASLEGRDFGAKQALVGLVSILLMGAFVLAGAWSAVSGASDVRRGDDPRIPGYVAQNEIEFDAGTLIIDARRGSWNLRYAGQTFWGQATYLDGPVSTDSARTVAQQVVARALAGRTDDTVIADLASLGVSRLVILDPTTETITALDATTGLQRGTTTGATQIWSVTDEAGAPTRRALTTPGGPTVYLGSRDEVPAGSPRTLVLALPPDPALRVTVGGTEVKPTGSGDWRAAYALGTASGPLQFERTIKAAWVPWTQLGGLVVFIIFVFPPFNDQSVDDPRRQVRRKGR
ncbi:MAG: glycosyltransferase family 2 protein [Propionibacteriaceae bacterium]|jgi:GT2 family glycosyltransferase|nr:glycosyltransferase family 2 protein [Propionibacteriaceae bacterium]